MAYFKYYLFYFWIFKKLGFNKDLICTLIDHCSRCDFNWLRQEREINCLIYYTNNLGNFIIRDNVRNVENVYNKFINDLRVKHYHYNTGNPFTWIDYRDRQLALLTKMFFNIRSKK